MACEKIDFCEYRITRFIYEKACMGTSKRVYCPKLQKKHKKCPREWNMILEID